MHEFNGRRRVVEPVCWLAGEGLRVLGAGSADLGGDAWLAVSVGGWENAATRWRRWRGWTAFQTND